jgi:SAM-dependent methyltransferase
MTAPALSPLEVLLAADGLAAAINEVDWRNFVEQVVASLDVGPGTSIWDVGCGAGAFLYPLWENGYVVGGIDPRATSIAAARAAMPQGKFVVDRPATLQPAEPWDVVVASQGLSGCTDLDQARGLLARMAAKATHAVAVLNLTEGGGSAAGISLDRSRLLRMLVETGVTAIQFESGGNGRFHVYAKV